MSILGTTSLGDPSDDSGVQQPAAVSGGIVPAAAAAAGTVSQPSQPQAPTQAPQPAPQSTSRLGAIIQAVAKVADTALAGIPDRGRPSFVTGLGEGARAEQNAVAQQNAVKFKTFDDQVRLAQLHNQDQKLQLDTEAQRDAHTKAELDNRALANSLGINYDTIASDGPTVMGHLEAQTAASGAASVPPGTHLSGDGASVNIPQNTPQTQAGQKQMYGMLAPAYGLPPLNPNSQFVPPQLMNMLTNKIHGYEATGPRAGQTPSHDDLPGKIGALQIQRDQMAKDGAPPQVLQALDNTLGIYKANLDALDKHAADVKAKSKQAELDAENSPQSIAGAAKKASAVANAELPAKKALQDNSAENKAQAASGDAVYATDQNGNVIFTNRANVPQGSIVQKVTPKQVQDDRMLNNRLADVGNKIEEYRQAMATPISASDATLIGGLIQKFGVDFHGINLNLGTAAGLQAAGLSGLSQAGQDRLIAYRNARESLVGYQRVLSGSGRSSEQAMNLQQDTLPAPNDPEDYAAKSIKAFNGNLNIVRRGMPVFPGDKQQQQQRQTPSGGSRLGQAVAQNPKGFINQMLNQ